MRVLCITDQYVSSRESLVQGIFRGALLECCTIHLVVFSRETKEVIRDGNEICIPYRYKRKGCAQLLGKLLDLHQVDVVIVRNFFPVLRSFLGLKGKYAFKLGFWNTFPHTFRRYFEAVQENRSLLRKRLEYRIRTFFEKRLVRRCDFLVVMSEEFKRSFYGDIPIAYHCLPMGFELANLPGIEARENPVKKFIYIGTVDRLRRVELIVEAMTDLGEDFVLDIFTQSSNDCVERIGSLTDPRIRLCTALPRQELFEKMATYDVGIGLIPENALYKVSSPTKTIEYYAVGLPALVNYLPEYTDLFNEESAFFCPFTKEGIQQSVRAILQTRKETLVQMGRRGKQAVVETRNYPFLSAQLFEFLQSLC